MSDAIRKRARLLLLGATCCLLACTDDGPSSPDGAGSDSSLEPVADAAAPADADPLDAAPVDSDSLDAAPVEADTADMSGDLRGDTGSSANATDAQALDVLDGADAPRLAGGACALYGVPTEVGRLPPGIFETSGIARSRIHDDTFWIHSDSGQEAVLHAISHTGDLLATIRLVDAQGDLLGMGDWEDIAPGPCGDDGSGACLYVGDVGDNSADRESVEVLQVVEPAVLADIDLTPTRMTFRYETGPQDVEAIFVDEGATVHLINKRLLLPHVSSVAWRPGPEEQLATHRGALDVPILPVPGRHFVTAADFDVQLGRVLVRTYLRVFDCLVDRADPGAVDAWSCREAPAAFELLGEAITWERDGAFLHLSEAVEGPLYRVGCGGG